MKIVLFDSIHRNSANRKIPSSIKCFFLVTQLCFGINFGFIPVLKKRYRRVATVLTLLSSCVNMTLITAPGIFLYDNVWFWFNFIKYISFFIVLSRLKYNVYDLIVDINEICNISSGEKKLMGWIIFAYLIVTDGIKAFFMAIRCILEVNPYCSRFGWPLYVSYIFPVMGLDCIGIAQTIIYCYIKCCVKSIKEYLENSSAYKYQVFNEHYKALVRCYEIIRPLYDKMIILELAIMVPKALATLWSLMYYLKNSHWYSYMTEAVFVFHLTIQICTPAIMAEMVNSQIDSIKQMLKERCLLEKDEKEMSDIQYTLRLLETRRLNHLVLRFIPIDLRLLLSLFTLCTSYFIVILQFSHLYD